MVQHANHVTPSACEPDFTAAPGDGGRGASSDSRGSHTSGKARPNQCGLFPTPISDRDLPTACDFLGPPQALHIGR